MDQKNKPVFGSAKTFERKFKEYIGYCKSDDVRKLPNTAGFCCFCNIMRKDFMRLKNIYPKVFDVAMSMLLDEALNTKIPNTGTTLDYIRNEINGYIGIAETGSNVEIICEHDSYEDGA